mmetsp:Transcript_12921/g.16997  ORF Transcript_12921/g.16997 Transcript_12921/m.16997 type:complete len:312 (+) Transcript_12921:34-969(+)|eukprot:CAMPEP_0117758220 /NCGR_PEP_ID=MMETSP0947-20121206/15244_1 /TAXON_ID=44440 /ORGANISM="Chattonella subsalsa, Strain CCMP2191" /LENGTH=311 /DNA_ID=CAMNT_0005578357 /DNA_START=34 /DNA_END=969 /DNA_ORIENTATION=-
MKALVMSVSSKVVQPLAEILKATPPTQSGMLFSGGVIGSLNLVGFALTAALETHKLTDLVGAGSFVVSAIACAIKSNSWEFVRPTVLNACITLWGTRLAGYLFRRVLKVGGDDRLDSFFPEKGEKWFDPQKSFYPVKLSSFWIIQAMWGWLVSAPVTMANFAPQVGRGALLGWHGKLFLGTFMGGFLLESVADQQKWEFKNDPANKGKWIETGVWKYSRHPNYFGEMVVWWSLFGLSLPLLRGPRQVLLGLASPAFTTFLLMKVSGVPMLEEKYDKIYANDEDYSEYKKRTNLLVPWFPKSASANEQKKTK